MNFLGLELKKPSIKNIIPLTMMTGIMFAIGYYFNIPSDLKQINAGIVLATMMVLAGILNESGIGVGAVIKKPITIFPIILINIISVLIIGSVLTALNILS